MKKKFWLWKIPVLSFLIELVLTVVLPGTRIADAYPNSVSFGFPLRFFKFYETQRTSLWFFDTCHIDVLSLLANCAIIAAVIIIISLVLKYLKKKKPEQRQER